MPGPGDLAPIPLWGSARTEDLPKTKVCIQSRNYRRRRCPYCGHGPIATRSVAAPSTTWASPSPGGRANRRALLTALLLACRKYFNADMADLANPGSHYTRRVIDIAVRLVVEDGLPYRTAGWTLSRDHRVFVPYATIQNWVEAGGKKGARRSTPSIWIGPLGLLGLHRRRRAV